MSSQQIVDEVVGAMNELVERDGGAVSLVSWNKADPTVTVRFKQAQGDEDCASCAITADMLAAFVLEGLRSHGVDVASVDVLTEQP